MIRFADVVPEAKPKKVAAPAPERETAAAPAAPSKPAKPPRKPKKTA